MLSHEFSEKVVKPMVHINDVKESGPEHIHKLRQVRLAIQLGQYKWHPIKGGTVCACGS